MLQVMSGITCAGNERQPLDGQIGYLGFEPTQGVIPNSIGSAPAFVTISPVTITGDNLSSVEEVTFAGVRAVFTVDSPTKITAIPPIGAHSGPLLITPKGQYSVPTKQCNTPADYTVTNRQPALYEG